MPDDFHHCYARQRLQNCAPASARGIRPSRRAHAPGSRRRFRLSESGTNAKGAVGIRPLAAWAGHQGLQSAALNGGAGLVTCTATAARAATSGPQPSRPPSATQ